MAVFIGVTNLDGMTAPAVGAVQSRESEESVGFERERGADGVTAYLVPHKYTKKNVTIAGVGDAELSDVAAGAITAGTLKIIRAKQTETSSGLPKFEQEGLVLANLS